MIDEDGIRQRWESIGSKLDEREQRLWAASEVQAAEYGALAVVARITGLARSTINRGEDDLDEGPLPDGRVRRKGGGDKPKHEKDPTLIADLKRIVEPVTLGSPVQPLTWVSKSHSKLARALADMGHAISAGTVAKLLADTLGFSRQRNRKADEGSRHPDRNAQFEHINAKISAAQAAGQPVISVDTKKKELVGNYRNGGSDYRPKGEPVRVKVHDFEDKELGKVAPYADGVGLLGEGQVVVPVNQRFAPSNPALLSAPSKKSFSRVSSPILACSAFTSIAGVAGLPLAPQPNTSAAPACN